MKEAESEIPEKVSSFILSWSGLLCHRKGIIKERLASFTTISITGKKKKIVESQMLVFYTAARQVL